MSAERDTCPICQKYQTSESIHEADATIARLTAEIEETDARAVAVINERDKARAACAHLRAELHAAEGGV